MTIKRKKISKKDITSRTILFSGGTKKGFLSTVKRGNRIAFEKNFKRERERERGGGKFRRTSLL